MQKVTKDQLIHKFRGDIVASLINEKEEVGYTMFLVEPKIVIQQRVWKEMNPRSVKFRTLQEELNMTYNKMDFLKDQEEVGTTLPSVRIQKDIFQRKVHKHSKALKTEEDKESARETDRLATKQTTLA